jgi:predicted RNase H-like nuclease
MSRRLVLGIDAAWTARGSSGIALLACESTGCSVIAAAPSYASFLARAKGTAIDFRRPVGGVPDVADLLEAARTLGDGEVECIALDLPMSENPIDGRRDCDNDVAHRFGARGASVHSPSADRPDALVNAMVRAFVDAGFQLAKQRDVARPLLEVFPLAALVQLLGTTRAEHRPRYKAAKTRKYWPLLKNDREARIDALMAEWQRIRDALTTNVGELNIPFPARDEIRTFAELKPYEDALDAVICAWIGAEYLTGRIERYPTVGTGDAIWIPPPNSFAPETSA